MLTACGGGGTGDNDGSLAASTSPAPKASDYQSDLTATETPANAVVAAAAPAVLAAAQVQVAGPEADPSAAIEAALAEASEAQAAAAESLRTAQASARVTTDTASAAATARSRPPIRPVVRVRAPSGEVPLTIRTYATLAGNVGAQVQVLHNGVEVASTEVRDTAPTDLVVLLPSLASGDHIDIAFVNDGGANGEDRNLFVQSLSAAGILLVPTAPSVTFDRGAGDAAFDGQDTMAGRSNIYWNGALRVVWPTDASPTTGLPLDMYRLLMQASFGPKPDDLQSLARTSASAWVNQQLAFPFEARYVPAVQARYARGSAYRPGGAKYDPTVVGRTFWQTAQTAPDQLRRRVGFALHQIFMVSQRDSNLWNHSRAYAQYLDNLDRLAFGNFRDLMEEMALSPAMGIYLSHMRNRPEDLATGRAPDENFARELMQLFTIGLQELNADGSVRTDASGNPIDTYTNADVMALAKVFTGWSWGLPDAQLTERNFRWGNPDYTAAGDAGLDLVRMKAYPGQHSSAEKRLFAGKTWAVTIPAGSSAQDSLRIALDALFQHPNVGPFIGRQLIQRLVTSHPSAAYVARVSAAFANNGHGVRGDLSAVVRAILLDDEARSNYSHASFGKLREPVLRVAQWMRAFDAVSLSGEYRIAYATDGVSQRAMSAPSVFGYNRSGYIPPGSPFSAASRTAPEFQLLDESTAAAWVNLTQAMTGNGIGWMGTGADVSSSYETERSIAGNGQPSSLVQRVNQLLLGGRMSTGLQSVILDALLSVSGTDDASQLNRARLAVMLTMASPEFQMQR